MFKFMQVTRWPLRNNHTGTHILNLALRKTLGDGIDQKGSLVAAEKLRFDFSHKSGISLDDLKKIEDICNKQIEDNLQVYSKPVELELAKEIKGLRAVFGETYPDPVRVVSVGIPVEDLLSNPSNEEWENYSIEFCGGTHVAKTNDIKKFVITEENGIAKGIRRIVALSGTEAFEAQRIANEFNSLLDSIDKLPFGDEKEKRLKENGTKLSQLNVSLLDKDQLKNKFNKIDKEVKNEIKIRQKADSKKTLDTVKNYFIENKDSEFLVTHVPINANAKVITEAINFLKKENKDKSLFLITGKQDESKIAQGVYISDVAIAKGLDAAEIANVASKFIGGKAGGKGNVCQGMGTESAGINDAIDAVEKLLKEKLSI
ncbi:unnamed protein product [[Candida] boidinii]|uniref:Unnamed protein product n=1 Tax=Candida boidinii TaxID=5477 RepID=A0ACB5TY92_CANBO|nr:unnamed protein product [[Candida] boidinii]